VSITTGDFRSKITIQILADKKQNGERITALTAYDYAIARLVDEAGMDVVLVGDSLAQAMLGYDNTLPVTVEEMIHHTKAVRRAIKRAFLIADMPFGSYHISCREGLAHAARFVKEGGAEAVKIEGGEKRIELINKIIDAEIPVCGHIGLTPQSVHKMGGYKVQGKTLKAVEQLMHDAVALDRAGVCLLVLEGIPREVAAMITREVHTPTIGIGAGPECDGQILVFHDLVNLSFGPSPKFVRRYADAGALIRDAVKEYCADIRSGAFPSDSESYHLPQETQEALQIVTSRRTARK
jgi:3-methyl-2-oxobutanoate hydroxymethyltransferase